MSKISDIEKYLEEEQLKYHKIKKYKILSAIICSILVVSIVFFKRPEPTEIEVTFKNVNEETKINVISNKTLNDALEELNLTSQNIYYLDDEIITFKELQKMKVKEKLVISYIVVLFEEETRTEVVEFETERKEDDSLSVGVEIIQAEGKVGSKEISTKVTLHDGVEVNKETKEKVIVNATNKVILVGTKVETVNPPATSPPSSGEGNSSNNSSSGGASGGSSGGSSGGDSDKEYEIEIR